MTSSSADAPRVEVHHDRDALATAIAGELLIRLTDAQVDGGTPHVGLTGGTIAGAVHRELARLGPDSPVDWSRVQLWWGDERFVDAASDDRNATQAHRDFIDALPIPAEHVHELASPDDAADVEAAAAAYADDLRAHGTDGFEVLMLGVGEDGHVASLFPGYPQLEVTDEVAVAVRDSPKPPDERVSLTFPVLNRARSAWFLVSGDGKADAVAAALAPDGSVEHTPARGVAGTEDSIWFLDRDAASRL